MTELGTIGQIIIEMEEIILQKKLIFSNLSAWGGGGWLTSHANLAGKSDVFFYPKS
mgnify:CR=1 FL=1